MKQLFDIELPKLSAGAHPKGWKELCAMELVAFMERLPHSDRPECTCPVIAEYVRRLNDKMDDNSRQRLLPYLSRLVGTVSEKHEQERARYIALYAVNNFAVKACEGKISQDLVDAMRNAKDLVEARNAAYAAAYADYVAAHAAYVAAADVAHDAYAAHDAHAAVAAAHAAVVAAVAAAYAAKGADIWGLALRGLEGMLAIGPQSEVKWQKERADEALAHCLK